ncbi:MAG TPA: FliM/FliN family flagellar motor switch protein [Kofleriaceae bacterium]|nr:FliM/FliN family flagellar motor switch protein [Kofleriaceae bacterium]
MAESRPSFSPFPFEGLRRVTRREAALESAMARWIAARPPGARVAQLAGGPVRIRLVGHSAAGTGGGMDPYAALAEVRAGGASIVLAASAAPVRALAERLLGGAAELPAPRPLGVVEHAIFALAVAAAIEDAGAAAEVWPLAGPPADRGGPRIELLLELPDGPMTVVAYLPPDLELRAPPERELAAWSIALPLVAGRCAITRAAVRALAPRDVILLEGAPGRLALEIGDGAIGLVAAPGAMAAEVATGYVRRDMALPDEAHLELTVQLGTARLSLRRISELAVGEVIPLGRPLAGPYEVRAAGQLVGHGELLDVDGELGVRIVSLVDRSVDRSVGYGPSARPIQE